MSRAVVPVRDLARRIPVGGRIRIGVKSGKAMKAIETFRFTSQNRPALDEIAALYGGTVKPWSDPKAAPGQFEVITDANEIRIALPPDPLGGTPAYELWSGGGRQRCCDGETCEMLVNGADGIDLVQAECICFTKGALECRLITRLSVILPEIRFVGVWRIDTKSQNAAVELPGMVELIRSLQDRGLTRGLLRIESRRQVTAGETRQFKVPVLGIDASVEALAPDGWRHRRRRAALRHTTGLPGSRRRRTCPSPREASRRQKRCRRPDRRSHRAHGRDLVGGRRAPRPRSSCSACRRRRRDRTADRVARTRRMIEARRAAPDGSARRCSQPPAAPARCR